MPRGFKNRPVYWTPGWRDDPAEREVAQFYAQTTKAQWADLYFDVLTQLNGDTTTLADAMTDATTRLAILARMRS